MSTNATPSQPTFQSLLDLLSATAPQCRILALLIFLAPASLLLAAVTVYRADLNNIRPPDPTAHVSSPWAAEAAFGSLFASLFWNLFLLARLSFGRQPLPLIYYLIFDTFVWGTIATLCTIGLVFSNTISWGRYEGIDCSDQYTAAKSFSCKPGFGAVQGLELGGVLSGWALCTYHGILAMRIVWWDMRRERREAKAGEVRLWKGWEEEMRAPWRRDEMEQTQVPRIQPVAVRYA